jgi:thiol-disulfide isomerase/thioredoxin
LLLSQAEQDRVDVMRSLVLIYATHNSNFMSIQPANSEPDNQAVSSPQTNVAKLVANARALMRLGEEESLVALSTLEDAMSEARATPYEVEFQTRVDLAITLGDLYVSRDDLDKARRMLAEEAEFAEKIFQIMQATGTQDQKRAAAGGRVQVRDRARQVALLGDSAPEITIKDWINGERATLAELRGRVVLLEFWATWCKPCQAMFPKLKNLDDQYRSQGLEVIALTRHYFAGRDVTSSQSDELELMRSVITQHELEFRVGVANDESLQEAYGATGMPTIALIDRNGIVRYAHFGGGEDPRFHSTLMSSLSETRL